MNKKEDGNYPRSPFEGNDFANAATRLMDASVDLAKVDQGDLDMTIWMAISQVGDADWMIPTLKKLSLVKS